MNKKTISIICLTILYSFFFYEQHVGINFLLFTLSTLGLYFFQDRQAFKNRSVLLLSFGAIFAASFAAVHGSNLSLWATIIALLVIPGVIINRRSNVFIDLSTSIVNIAASTTFMIIEMIESGKKGKGKGFLRLLKYLVPLVFVITFFFIYRAMNPLFEKLTQDIAEFISIGLVFFTLGGFVLVYSVYKQRRAKDIDNWEKNWLLNIDPTTVKTPKWNEAIAFILLFIVLNLMLASVNLMDINYLYLGEGMPDGITHKQFVHKGVGMLILSIILGISILLFFFRGALNFSKNKHVIKALAFLWVAQNVFMVVSTSIRNTMYVDAALLTYKRIGVYFWLFFALVGLITLLIKLHKNKTVWFLARYNFATLFVVLLLSSAADWDMVISDFNLSRAHKMEEISSLDKNYMLSLSEGNIAGLFKIKDMEGFEIDSVYSYQDFNHLSNSNWLDCKVYDFLLDDAEGDWRSYSTRRTRVRNEIDQLHQNGQLNTLELQGHYVTSLDPIFNLTNLKELNLNSNNFNTPEKLSGINELQQLTKLSLNENYIYELDTLMKNTSLQNLSLSGNELTRLQFLKSFPNLDSLDLSNNKLITTLSFPKLKKLKTLVLNGNPITDISKLSILPNLTELSLNQVAGNVGNFPKLSKLQSLYMSGSPKIALHGIKSVKSFPSLSHLDMSYNNLGSLNSLINKEHQSKVPQLKNLLINSNGLRSLYGINTFKNLEYLDASYNEIYSLQDLEELTKMKYLFLSNNSISTLKPIENLSQLKELNISENPNISNFEALQNLQHLTMLNLSGNGIRDLNDINKSAPLTHLHLTRCRITNWETIKSFEKLESISVSFIKKEDVKHFKELPNLKYITVSNTEEIVIQSLKEQMPGVEVF